MRAAEFGEITIGPFAEFQHGAVLRAYGGSIRLGKRAFIGPYVVIYGHGGVDVGDHCLISMHSRVLSSNHFVPSSERRIRDEPDVLLPTRIGRDVWLGAGVTVLGGVTIGDGCVVGAGAVVTKDIPPYSIAVGVPARVIGDRH
jgi:acetyltransferase-like isoleucine patch superfamily enzyme